MGLEEDADSHSVHLEAFVVQLFQHSFSFKVTILMVKRVEVQSLFRSLSEVAETTILQGTSILVFCLVSENVLNSIAFLVIFLVRKETKHNYVKTGPANLF